MYESVIWSLVGPICAMIVATLVILMLAFKASLDLKGRVDGFSNLRYVREHICSLLGNLIATGSSPNHLPISNSVSALAFRMACRWYNHGNNPMNVINSLTGLK
jgi:hypothetical protein